MKAATITLVAMTMVGLGVTPARADITVPETNCIDTVVSRAGWTTLVRPAVPERYGLRLLTPAGGEPGSATNFFIIDQYCEDVTVHGEHSVPTTTTYVLAPITSIDGNPVPPGQLYTLYIGTNNPELFALFRSAGFPAEFLPTSSSSVTQISDTSTQVIYTIDSAEWGHTFTVVSSPPQAFVFDPGATYLYDGRRGPVSLTVVNDQGPIAPATISGTHLGSTLTEWLVTPLTITNVRFPTAFRTGDHTLSVTWPPSASTPSDSG